MSVSPDVFRSRGRPCSFTPDSGVKLIGEALESYARCGVRIPTNNRLELARSLFTESQTKIDTSDQGFLSLLRDAHFTALEHYIISRALQPRPGPAGDLARSKIGQALSGAPMECQDRNHLGRNTQFELFAGAILAMGDVRIEFGEPDLFFQYRGLQVGLAAKRAQNDEKLRKRAREAMKQLKNTHFPGFVVLCLDRLSDPESMSWAPQTQEQPRDLETVLPVLRRIDAEIQTEPMVLGRLAFLRESVWNLQPGQVPSLVLGFRFHLRTFLSSDADNKTAYGVFGGMVERINAQFSNL